ncbi:MAG: hypothetical protein O2955_14645 [Planctomycetota bacterium]|nr:hypothetical protein [Planctomycetota bacterium]MDA1213751.1 hypothetical protein [Planctomycetota bacterium]
MDFVDDSDCIAKQDRTCVRTGISIKRRNTDVIVIVDTYGNTFRREAETGLLIWLFGKHRSVKQTQNKSAERETALVGLSVAGSVTASRFDSIGKW